MHRRKERSGWGTKREAADSREKYDDKISTFLFGFSRRMNLVVIFPLCSVVFLVPHSVLQFFLLLRVGFEILFIYLSILSLR